MDFAKRVNRRCAVGKACKRGSGVQRPPAVVVGDGLGGLGVLRSLATAGVPVILLGNNANNPAMRSRHGIKVLYRNDRPDSVVEALLGVGERQNGRRLPLILTQEDAVSAVSRQRERLRPFFQLGLPEHHALVSVMHKDGFRAAAEAAGGRIPRARRVRSEADLAALEQLQPPLVVKPAVRNMHYAQRFRKAYRLENRGDASVLLQRILPVFADLIVQEWIEGADSDLYFCLQYIPAGQKKPVSFVGRKIRSWPPQVGGTSSCIAAPEASELVATTTAFFQQAGITGLASMEYKRHSCTGEYFMVEPTIGRTDHQEEVASLNGVNLPLAAYRDAMDAALPSICRVSPQRVWRDRDADLQSMAASPKNMSRIPPGTRTVNALWRASDPMPALASLKQKVSERFKRVARDIRTRSGIRGARSKGTRG